MKSPKPCRENAYGPPTSGVRRASDAKVSASIMLPTAVRANPTSTDLVLTLAQNGDRVTLVGALASGNAGSNTITIEFADGTRWGRDVMRARSLEFVDGSGDDTVFGYDGADLFVARPGDDVLIGDAAGDSYEFGIGSGNDAVEDFGLALLTKVTGPA